LTDKAWGTSRKGKPGPWKGNQNIKEEEKRGFAEKRYYVITHLSPGSRGRSRLSEEMNAQERDKRREEEINVLQKKMLGKNPRVKGKVSSTTPDKLVDDRETWGLIGGYKKRTKYPLRRVAGVSSQVCKKK